MPLEPQPAPPRCSACSAFTWPRETSPGTKFQQFPHCSPRCRNYWPHHHVRGESASARGGKTLPGRSLLWGCYLYLFLWIKELLWVCHSSSWAGQGASSWLVFYWIQPLPDDCACSAQLESNPFPLSILPSSGVEPPRVFGGEVYFICFPQLDQNPPPKIPEMMLCLQ